MAAPSQSPLGAPLSFAPAAEGAEQAKLQEVQELQRKLAEAYQARPMFDPALLAMARGFGAPTRTGSFFESLGNVAGELGPVQEAQQQRAQEIARMKFEMSRNELNEQQKKRILGSLFVESQDAAGNKVLSYNPQAAKDLTMLTGDPKYVADLADQMRKQNLQSAYSSAFVPTESGQYKINTGAIKNIFSLAGPEEAQKFFKSIPEMRKSGMLADLSGDKTTPFDALVLLADTLGPKVGPAFKQQAQYLAQQYSKGLLDEEKANNQAKDLLTAMNSTVGRQESLENTKSFREFQQMMGVSMMEFRREQERRRAEEAQEKQQAKAEEAKGKLTDEQKIAYRQTIQPIIQKGNQAQQSIDSVDNLLAKVNKAPSGALAGAYASSVGALFGTDSNTALRELDTWSKNMLTQIPRLPGAQSNFDAQNLEKALGNLPDIRLTNQQRVQLLNEIKQGFARLRDTAIRYEEYWNENKKVLPLSEQVKPKEAQPAAPKAGQAQGVPVWDPNTKTWK